MVLGEQVRQRVVGLLRDGVDIKSVSSETGVAEATVARWGRSAGLLQRVRRAGGGRKPILDDAGLKVLAELVEANRRMTQEELVAAFAERTGKSVSKPTLGKAMKTLGYRKVRLQKALSVPAPQSAPRYGDLHRRPGSATMYPSSLTDREWEVLAPLLAKQTGRGRPPRHDKRALVDAVMYQVRTGNQWRYMPKDFPPWPAVWSFFWRARDSGLLERIYDALRELWRRATGHTEAPTAGIVDSQTVKSTEKGGFVATTPARKSRGSSGIWSWTQPDFPAQS